jgi:spore germination cell wall hydrolase CwlJ-like protein
MRTLADWIAIIIVTSIALTIGTCTPAHAETEWTTENVYKAIVTESIGEGREGMEYVASCFWNRRNAGMSLGSCGVVRSNIDGFLHRQPESLLCYAHHLADRVIHGADSFDVVKGATQFESTDFPVPSWAKTGDYIEVFRYKKHVFYRRIK